MTDTSEEARQVQTAVYRRMSGSERFRMALDMSEFTRRLAMARLRRQHPDWSDAVILKEVLRYAYLPGPMPDPLR